ncbi:CAP domain-containing protein [Nocardioides ginsengisoli]|uniref:CAP domain-containing protein n=1 Tax=Nocardioides ginsengisoli TaxID=363868 RepID=A0ABW3VVK0_9ACTN
MRLLPTALGVVMLLIPVLAAGPSSVLPAASASAATATTTGAPVTPRAGVSEVEARLIARVNQTRTRHGCRALKHRDGLHGTASAHSALMAQRQQLSHQLAGEPSLRRRLSDAGYQRSGRIGEIIAVGTTNPSGVMRMWMASRTHRTIILDCRYRMMGVGVTTQSSGQRWWTIDFAR